MNWSDATAPGPGNDYTTGFLLRTPTGAGPFTFGGDSLQLNAGSTLLYKGTGKTITINDLRLNGGALTTGDNATFTLAGNISVIGNSSMSGNDGTRIQNVTATITGSGNLTIGSNDTSGGGNTITTILSANNSGYSGNINLANTANNLTFLSIFGIHNNNAVGTGSLTIGSQGITLSNSSGSAVTLAANNPQTWNYNFGAIGANPLNLGTGAVSLGTTAGTSRTVDVGTGADLTVGGVISNGTTANSLIKRGAGILNLTGNNTYSGSVTVQQGGTLSVSSIGNTGVAQPLGQGSSAITLDGSGGGGPSTLRYTGGTASTNRGFDLLGTASSGGRIEVSNGAATLTLNGNILSVGAGFEKSGPGALTLTGQGGWTGNTAVSGGTLTVGGSTGIPNTGIIDVATGASLVINTSGQVRGSNLNVLNGGTVTLTGGTLRTDAINLNASGTLNWGAATLSVRDFNAGNEGSTDRTGPGGAPSGPVVYEGTILDVAGSLASTSGSVADLGNLYLSGALRYDQLTVSGTLDLSAAGDTLLVAINPYLLRPTSPSSITTGDWGSLILVDAGTLTGTFDTVTGILNDSIGWTSAGVSFAPVNPAVDLGLNSYILEYDAAGGRLLFHYKVAGSVPEPGSFLLLGLGAAGLRAIRRLKRAQQVVRPAAAG